MTLTATVRTFDGQTFTGPTTISDSPQCSAVQVQTRPPDPITRFGGETAVIGLDNVAEVIAR